MYCVKCGAELPDDAIFCPKCGKPQKPDEKAEEPEWDTCEIVWVKPDEHMFLAAPIGHFKADATGPNGAHTIAGQRDVFGARNEPDPYDELANQALRDLIDQLVEDGWELTETRSSKWYAHRFRRLASARRFGHPPIGWTAS